MRKLNIKDIFILSKIYSKMEIKLEIDNKITQTEMGAQLINKFIGNLHKAQNEVVELLSSIKGVSKEEFEEMSPKELITLVKEIAEQEGAKDFFTQAMQ